MVVDPNDHGEQNCGRGGAAKSGIARLNMQYQSPMPQALQLIPEDVATKI